jgi:gamma-butyrobetaine hydroxylase
MVEGHMLDTDFLDTELSAAPPTWLRDNCACSQCRDPRTGQKLFQITDLPDGLAMRSAAPVAGTDAWEVLWAPDGHRSRYESAWLIAGAEPDERGEDAKRLWGSATELAGLTRSESGLPECGWDAYTRGDAERLRMLEAVRVLGFCLLRDVPTRDGQVRDVVRTFGYVRETNYGSRFEVRVEEQPNNLAFTTLAISPHTDNPYRDPVPTLQVLHCLVNDAEGGDSGLVDGFAAAARLREAHPDAFAALTGTPAPFVFRDADCELRALRPIIGTDVSGLIREIRFNNRSLGTLRAPAERVEAFYAAYRAFGAMLLEPARQLDFRLGPGDCLVFDNTRMLHARTAFSRGGARHLQGCYADLDGLLSTLAVLRARGGSR